MKRRALPDLSHVLDDSRPLPAVPVVESPGSAGTRSNAQRCGVSIEKRIHTRFDKAFLVVIGSEIYGDSVAIARNVSAGGILVEMTYAPPLGTVVTVHFQYAREGEAVDELVARAEVKHHHYLNFAGAGDQASARAIGLRFLEFVDAGERIDPERIH
ncbi:MAG: hypothetical protein ACM31C_12320 [Acidobacteriota bacterium]